ncbi:MAG: hypothetical protein ABW352_20295 [Polyangiales bacterium]
MACLSIRARSVLFRGLVSLAASGCARAPNPYLDWLPVTDEDEQVPGEVDSVDASADASVELEDAMSVVDAKVDAAMQCAAIRDKAPVAQGVDVIFVVDSSGTMLHAVGQVQANIADFVSEFAAAGKDVRVVMISALDPAGRSPVASDREKYMFIQANVLGGRLYSTAIDQFESYQSFLRPTAAVEFVMVTSSNDTMSPSAFQTAMEALLGGRDFTQHAIASPDVNGLPCISESQAWNPLCAFPIPAICAALQVGRAYNSLAEQTGGEQLSVCKDDWGDVFATLKKSVIDAVPLPCNFLLPTPDKKKIDPDKVSMFYTSGSEPDQQFPRAQDARQCQDKLGWYYDDPYAPTTVKLCPAACEAVSAGGSVDIAFGCAPPMIL